ncbi:MAG: HAD family hydrolase [Treponema sp.]|nr:HAD family hydrolase [Treponema sp.]
MLPTAGSFRSSAMCRGTFPLFSESTYSVAPANAKEQVRNSADLVVASNAEDGVAAFLESAFQL